MEDLYKNALQDLRKFKKTSHAEQMYWCYTEENHVLAKDEKADLEETLEVAENSNQNTNEHKEEVLESFTQFANEKLEDQETIKFTGGEIRSTKNEASDLEHSYQSYDSIEELKSKQLKDLPVNLIEQLYSKRQEGFTPKVCFVSDVFLSSKDAYQDEFSGFFNSEVSLLFSRMIKAMGLEEKDYFISAIASDMDEESSLTELCLSEINYHKPQFIVTLGAKATSEFLKNQNRLKNIHGQFFRLKFSDQNGKLNEASLMPLFSPNLLQIAPNMKKTAWEDMQKLMEKL